MASHRAANQGYVYGTAARNMAAERELHKKAESGAVPPGYEPYCQKKSGKGTSDESAVRDHADTGSSLRTVYLYRVSACAVLHDRKDPQH